jgi:hypothetical protein
VFVVGGEKVLTSKYLLSYVMKLCSSYIIVGLIRSLWKINSDLYYTGLNGMEMYLIAGDWSSLYNVEGCGRGCYILRGCLRAGNLRLWLSIRLYVLNIPLEEHLA